MGHFNGKNWQCACAVSRDRVVQGHPKPHNWNHRPQFTSSLCNFYGSTMTIKGSLHGTSPIAKGFYAKILSCQKRAQYGGFREEGELNVKFVFSNREKHILARNHVVWLFCVKIGSRAWAVGRWKKPGKKNQVNISDAQFRIYGEKKPLEGSWPKSAGG